MSRRRELESHRRALGEIREIMNSMKTLSYMEGRKLAGFMPAQHEVVTGIEAVAEDFVAFHPDTLPTVPGTVNIHLAIGSERGFCGDFNETLLRDLATALEADEGALLLAVGRKLHASLEGSPHAAGLLEGASVVEEVEPVLSTIVDTLSGLQARHDAINLYAHYHSPDEDRVVAQQLLPPFNKFLQSSRRFPYPPILNLAQEDFLLELTAHYLFALLHEILYASLMSESHLRMQHLDAAIRRLDEKTSALARQSNALRQEEITEEIEVILLSAASLDHTPHRLPASETEVAHRGVRPVDQL